MERERGIEKERMERGRRRGRERIVRGDREGEKEEGERKGVRRMRGCV